MDLVFFIINNSYSSKSSKLGCEVYFMLEFGHEREQSLANGVLALDHYFPFEPRIMGDHEVKVRVTLILQDIYCMPHLLFDILRASSFDILIVVIFERLPRLHLKKKVD